MLIGAAVALAVVAVGGLLVLNRDDSASVDILPVGTTSTTSTTTTSTTSSTTTAPATPPVDTTGLPDEGFAVTNGDGLMHLYDGAGTFLAETTIPDGPDNDSWMTLDSRTGLLVDTERPAALDVPAGCTSAAVGRDGGRWAICDEGRTIRVYSGDVVSMTVPTPAPDPDWTSDTLGRWRWVDPSGPVLALWGGECEVPTTFLVQDGAIIDAPGVALLSAVLAPGNDWWEAPATKPLATDGADLIIEVLPGLCSSETVAPGVYLVDDEPVLLVPYDDVAQRATWWVRGCAECGNRLEDAIVTALADLGLAGCCGEPSHGGPNARAGATVDGQGIFIWADAHADARTSHGTGPRLPSPDGSARDRIAVVSSSNPSGLGETIVTFSCSTDTFSLGGGDVDTMVGLADELIPRLGCGLTSPVLVEDAADDRLEVMAEWLATHFTPAGFGPRWEAEPAVVEQAVSARLDAGFIVEIDVILLDALFEDVEIPDATRYEQDGFVAGIGEVDGITVATFTCDDYVVSLASDEPIRTDLGTVLTSMAEGLGRSIPCEIGEPVIG